MPFQESIGLPHGLLDMSWKGIMTWFAIGQWAFDSTLMLRQYRVLRRPAPSIALTDTFSKEEFETGQAYNRCMAKSNICHYVIELAVAVMIIHSKFLANLWGLCGEIRKVKAPLRHEEGDIPHSISFYIGILLLTEVMQFPTQVYIEFFLSQKFNLGKPRQTIGRFSFNIAGTLVVNGLYAAAVTSVALSIVRKTGDHLVYYGPVVFATVKLCWVIFNTVTPPKLLKKMKPLEEGNLRTEIVGASEKEGFPFREIYVLPCATASTTIPMWIYGTPWKRTLVLCEKLQEQVNSREITATLVHEIGHWKLGHQYVHLAYSQVFLFMRIYLFCNLFIYNSSFYAAFGFLNSQPKIVGYVLYLFVLHPIKTAFGLLDKIWSRRTEVQADQFAMERGYARDLASYQLKMTKSCMALVEVDWMYALCKLGQLPLAERIKALGWTGENESKDDSQQGTTKGN